MELEKGKDAARLVADINNASEALEILSTGFGDEWEVVNSHTGNKVDLPRELYDLIIQYFQQRKDSAEGKLNAL